MKRFLDDLFKIFIGTTKQLHQLFTELNKLHETLKFTMEHTTVSDETEEEKCECESKSSIQFLDTQCSLENGKIVIDLYRKPTDRNQFLLPTSNHPKSTIRSIPFSQSLRIVRICTDKNKRDIRLEELRKLFLDRNYSPETVDRAIQKAKQVPRHLALRKKLSEKKEKRPVLALNFDPRLPNIPEIQAKHWRSMKNQDQYLSKVFPKQPMTAFRRENNLKSLLIRAKVPPKQKMFEARKLKGMSKCGKSCPSCPFILEGKTVNVKKNEKWHLNKKFTCESYNVVYMIECSKESCKLRYIGHTGRALKYRLAEHRGYANNAIVSKATGSHFTLPGHSQANIKITVLEQVKRNEKAYREVREQYHINKFNTFYQGLNRKQ